MSDREFSFTYRGEGEQRLDKFLVTCLPDFSRSRLQGLIQEGFVQVDRQVVVKASYLLGGCQQVEVRVPPPVSSELVPEAIPLAIVFENDDLMVVNKPAGMVVHPAVGHVSGTLIHAALAHAPNLEGVGGEQRPGVVHRLDKDTSGLILLAKNDATHQLLQNQFRLRRVKKVYLALVDGQPPTPAGRVEAPIGRDPAHRKRMAIVPSGKGREAVTEFYTVQNYRQHTLLEARPLTGRTHQIRIHMAFLGCPIVGDTLYGHKRATLPIERHFLHAARLTIPLPGQKEPSTFEAPLPPELQAVLDRLE